MRKNIRGKLLGAAASALVIAVPVLALAGLLLCFVSGVLSTGGYRLAAGILLLYAIPLLAVVVGIFAALHQRWKEVKGGEEDEARKY